FRNTRFDTPSLLFGAFSFGGPGFRPEFTWPKNAPIDRFFAPFIHRTGSWRSNDRPRNAVKSNQLKAIANVGRPPAQGVFDGTRFLGGRHRHATGTSPDQFRSSGWRLSEFAGAVGGSG